MSNWWDADKIESSAPAGAEFWKADEIASDSQQPDQEVVTSARAWRGAGAGRGSINDPRRLDTDQGRRNLAVEGELNRLEAINTEPRESLRKMAESAVDNPGPVAKPVDRAAQYVAKGYDQESAAANTAFDTSLEQKLNKRYQEAAPDAVTGERISTPYNPNTEAERVSAQEKELALQRRDASQRAVAADMPAPIRGLTKGAVQAYGLAQGSLAFAGDALGIESWKKAGIEGYTDTMRQAGNLSIAKNFTEITNASDAASWIAENGGYVAFQAAQSLMGAGLGGAALKGVGQKALGEAIGMGLINASQTFGSVYGEAVEEAKKKGTEVDLGRVAVGAVLSSAVDTLADKIGLDAVAARGFKGNVISRLGKSGAVQMGVQGGTEAAQLVPEEYGAGRDPFRKGIADQYINEAAVGALGGAGPGAAGAINRDTSSDPARALADALNAPLPYGISLQDLARRPDAPAVDVAAEIKAVREQAQAQVEAVKAEALADIGRQESVDGAIASATRAVSIDSNELLDNALKAAGIEPEALKAVEAQQAAAREPLVFESNTQSAPDKKGSVAINSVAQSDAATVADVQNTVVWTGRRGNGYASEEDASRALLERQRLRPGFIWSAKQNAEGRFVLVGDPRNTAAPSTASSAPAMPAGASRAVGDVAVDAASAIDPTTGPSAIGWASRNGNQGTLANAPQLAQPRAKASQTLGAEWSPQAASQPVSIAPPVRLGRDQTPLGEGGKPFKTRKAAGDAKKLQPMMRVVTVPGGYALADKTPAQLAAEAKAAKRLATPRTSARGEPIPAHAFVAAAGGLNPVAASDLGVDGNPRIGNRRLFSGQGRGLSMDQATQMLVADGYLGEGATVNDAFALIKRSLTQPQYNADGIERIAEAESAAQFEDYLAAQDDEFDPFGPAPASLDGFSDDMLESSGYDAAADAIKAEVRALLEMANAQGVDTESIMLDAHEQTRNATEQDYYESAKSALEAAITGSNRDRGTPAGSEGQGPGAADTSAAEQGLNQPVALDQQAQAATENVAPATLELAAQTPAEAAARQEEAERAEKSQAAAKRAADAAAKAEDERKRIAQASVRAADRFELGQDPMDSLTGQGSVFDAQEPEQQAPKATETVAAQPDTKNSTKPIEDAGEKIGGARKDRWKERGLNLDDLDAMTEAEGAELATKANVWKPDYEALSEASEPVTAAMVKTIYDQLAAKPKKNTPEGRRQYVQMMRIVRDVLTEAKGPDAVRNAYLEIRKRAGLNSALPAEKSAGRELMFSVYKGRSDPFVLGGADLMKAKKMVEDGFPAKGEPWKKRLSLRAYSASGFTPRGLEITLNEAAELGTPLTGEQIAAGFYRINTKDGKAVGYAPTKADAEATAKTIYERDLKASAPGKPEPVRPNLDELKRENLPKRIDRDVSADDFVNDLGFRGIEFGNWSAQDERQRILNMAYDGLMDLAEIMGVPPKAMSLNGTLGMAFGARGGGRFAAHYEPGKLVINMTKIRGGGSMAHEWAHAMDHYFGELDKPDAYTTQARGASGWYSEDQYLGVPRKRMERVGNEWKNVEKMRLDNLRPEMAAAFDEVMRALFKKQITKAEMVRSYELDLERTEALARKEQDADLKAMYQRMVESKREALDEMRADPDDRMYAGRGRTDYANQAQALSGKSVDGYWVRPTEMFARAFESWVFDRVTAMGAKSDYLVHGVEEDRFAGGAYKGNPYPTGEERARINAAFDKLAGTIKTKDTDKGVAMFSRASGSIPQSVTEWLPDTVIADEVEKRIGGFAQQPPVRIRDTAFGQLPGVARNDNVAGAVHDGAIYLFRDQLGDRTAVQRTLFHELFHFGLRKFLTKAQFTEQMMTLYRRDKAIKDEADRWAGTADGQRAREFGGNDYALARGVDEALAILAEPNGGPYLNQTRRAVLIRRLTNWLADVAQFFKMDGVAAYLRGMHNLQARAYIQSVFKRLKTDAGGLVTGLSESREPDFSRSRATDQTRTDAFKRWFGDWEAVLAQKRLDAMAPVRIASPAEWRGLPVSELREKVEASLLELMRSGEPLNHPEIGEVSVVRKGIKKALASSADPAKLLTLGDIRNAFESSFLASVQPALNDAPNVEAYEKLLTRLDVDGTEVVAVFTVQKLRDGRQFYNSVALDDAKEKTPVASPRDTPIAGERATSANTGVSSFVRQMLRRVNPRTVSKVVDAQGKPLVVYHATTADFSTFDRGAESIFGYGDNPDAGGIFFDADPRVVDYYAEPNRSGSRVIPVYLRIENPAILPANMPLDRQAKALRQAQQDGHDGAILGGMEYVVFGPEQIKSAIGNNGNFDRDDARINFSRVSAGLSAEEAVAMLNAERPVLQAMQRRVSDERMAVAQKIVTGMKQRWVQAPEIIVARNMQDERVPETARAYDATLKSRGASGDARGFIYEGRVYLLADELDSPEQIVETLLHEVVGHFGLRGAFGDGLKPILQQIGTMRRRDVLAKAREYGLFNKGALGGVAPSEVSDKQIWDAMSPKQRLDAAEEVLAEMAQITPDLGYVKRAIAAIRTWLRANVPGFKNLALTDAEIVRSYILPARGFVTRSNETPQQSLERARLAFSRGGSDTEAALRELAAEAQAPGNANKTLVLGPVSPQQLELLQREGVPVDGGFTHAADMFAVRHALNRHSDAKVEQSWGQIPITEDDVAFVADAIKQPTAYVLGGKTPRGQDVVGTIKRLNDGTLLYLEEVRTGRKTLAMTSMRKYPGTTDFDTIANSVLPSNARSDTGDVRIVYPEGGLGQGANPDDARINFSRASVSDASTKENLLNRRVSRADADKASERSGSNDSGETSTASGQTVQGTVSSDQVADELSRLLTLESAGDPLFSRVGTHIKSAVKQQLKKGLGPDQVGNRFTLGAETRRHKARRKLQDYFIRVQEVQRAVLGQGGVVNEQTDTYGAEVLSHGRMNALLEDFAKDQVQPLMEKAVRMNITLDELSLYAYAMHAKERNDYIASIDPNLQDGGSGMTNADADAILSTALKSGNQAEYEELHADLMAITAANRLVMLQEGLITQKEFAALEGAYEHYIPLRGFEVVDENNKPTGLSTGKGFNIRGAETIKALGRTSRAGQLVESVISDYQRTVVRSERNHVAKVFLNFVLQNPDSKLWEVDATSTRKSLDRQTGRIARSTTIEKGEDTIAVKVKGREIYIQIKDPMLARAMRKAHSDETGEMAKDLMRTVGLYTSLLRNTLTRYNPEFALVNAARDYGFGATAMLDVLGEKGAAQFTAHYAGAVAVSHRNERRNLDPLNRDWDKWFTEYRAAGGITGGFYQKGVEEISSDIRDMMVEAGAAPDGFSEQLRFNNVTRMAKGALRVLEYAGAVSENAARVAAYRTAREMGKTPSQAAIIAKNLTTNFDRKGEYGQILNALFVFFNAAVQGSHRTLKMLANGKVLSYAAGFTAGMVGLALANATAGGDDPVDGMAYWDKIPDYVKERNIVIMLPPGAQVEGAKTVGAKGRYLTIPVQYGLNLFPVIGYSIADLVRNQKDPVRGKGWAKTGINLASAFAGSFNPFGGAVDVSNGSSVAQAIMPSIFDPVVQFTTGTNAFGRDVAPFKSSFDEKPDSQNSNVRQAGGVAESVAQWLNSLTGGSAYASGSIDVSAGTLENLVRNLTGGTGVFLYDTLALADKALERANGGDPDLFIRDIPLLRRGYGETAGDVDQGLFYERRKQIQKSRSEEKGAQEAGEKITDPEKKALASLNQDATKYTKWLAEIRKEMKEVQQDEKLAKGDKRLKLRELRAERDQLTAQFNRVFTDVMRKELNSSFANESTNKIDK